MRVVTWSAGRSDAACCRWLPGRAAKFMTPGCAAASGMNAANGPAAAAAAAAAAARCAGGYGNVGGAGGPMTDL